MRPRYVCITYPYVNLTELYHIFLVLVVFICFVNQTLFVPEDDIVVVVTINITNPLSTDVTLTVDSTDVTATG